METLLKKLDFLGSTILKAVVSAGVILMCIAVCCVAFLLLSLAIDMWSLVVLGVLFFVGLAFVCYLGFKERERRDG